MKRPKLAFSSLGCPDYGVEKIIEAAKAYGYGAVSLRKVRGEQDLSRLEEFSPEALGGTRALFEKAGIEPLCVASGVSLGVSSEGGLERELSTLQAYLAIASGLGSPWVRVFGGCRGEGRLPAIKALAPAFRQACEMAASAGVGLLLETHDEFSRGDSVATLLAELGRDDLFVVWDLLHTVRHGESPEETWRAVGEKVRHVHLKDSINYDKNGFDLVLLGKGRLPLRETVALLDRVGYDGFLEFEWEKGWHPELSGPELALPHGAGWLEGLATGLEEGGNQP